VVQFIDDESAARWAEVSAAEQLEAARLLELAASRMISATDVSTSSRSSAGGRARNRDFHRSSSSSRTCRAPAVRFHLVVPMQTTEGDF
jgi:hypothetical protein